MTFRSRQGLAAAIGVLALVTITGAGWPSTVPARQPSGPPAVSTMEPTAQVNLKWRSCKKPELAKAKCAWLEVPRDWARNGSSGTYRIAVARIPARDEARRGVLIFNPGGPGGSGLDQIAGIHSILPAKVKDSFDLVTFDPRGVGVSQPKLATCKGAESGLPATGPVDWAAVTASYFDAVAAAHEECLAANSDQAQLVGSWQVIRDMDALRKALGQRQVTFWGMSYGTTLGRAYAQQFPQSLRALLLDGAITPTPSIGDYSREHIWDDATAVSTMLGAFDVKTRRAYRNAMAFLEDNTLEVEPGQIITRWNFSALIVNSVAYQNQWGEVADAILAVDSLIKTGRPAGAREKLRWVEQSSITPRDEGGSNPIANFVNCSDMHDRPDAAQVAGVVEQAVRVGGTTFGVSALVEGVQCAGLPPLGTALTPLTGVLRLKTPPVVLNSVADNRTPWLGARKAANAFAGASMVTYGGTQHVLYTGPFDCIRNAVTPYLLDLKRPATSVSCPLVRLRPAS